MKDQVEIAPGNMIHSPLSFKEKLRLVAADCGYVRKDGVNQFHKYNYATAATIFEKVNEALHDHRLISLPTLAIVESVARTNAKGGTETLATVEAVLRVEDVDSEEYRTARAYGSGMDNGDKAVMKAQTAALKYAWMMLLNISTGDDPEGDAKTDARVEGRPIPKPAPRGPYKPGAYKKPVAEPEAPGEAIAEEPSQDTERPAILAPEPPTELEQQLQASLDAMADAPLPEKWLVERGLGKPCEKEGCKGIVKQYTASEDAGDKAGNPYLQCNLAWEARQDAKKENLPKSFRQKLSEGHSFAWL